MARLGRSTCRSLPLLYSGALLLSVRFTIAQQQDSGAATTSQSREQQTAEVHVGFVIMGALALLTGLVALKRAAACRTYALTKDQSESRSTPSQDVDIEACTVTLHIDQADNQYALSSLQAKYIQDIITSLPTGSEFVEPDEGVKVNEPFAELFKLPIVSVVSEEAMADSGETKSPKSAKKKSRHKTLSKQGSDGVMEQKSSKKKMLPKQESSCTIEHTPSKKSKVTAKVDRQRFHKGRKALDSLPVQKSLSTPSRAQCNSTFLKIPGSSPNDHLDTDSHIDHCASEDLSAHVPSMCRGSSLRSLR